MGFGGVVELHYLTDCKKYRRKRSARADEQEQLSQSFEQFLQGFCAFVGPMPALEAGSSSSTRSAERPSSFIYLFTYLNHVFSMPLAIVFACVPDYRSAYRPICLSTYRTCLPICLSRYLPVSLSTCGSVQLY